MKRLLAIVLSAMMLLSTIPTSIFAFAADGVAVGENVTAISTLPDGATDNLSATSPYAGTQLKTKFSATEFQSRTENNLVSKVANSDVELQVTLDGSNLVSEPTASQTSVASMYDGVIDNGAQSGTHFYNFNALNGTDPQGYLTLKLDATYDISNIYLMSYFEANFAMCSYEIYVSDSKDGLYDSANLAATYTYNGYSMDKTAGKLNDTGIAEGQEFIFAGDTVPVGSYVGFKIIKSTVNTSYPYYFYICELGIEGTKYVESIKGNGNVTAVSDLPEGAASLITADSKYADTQLITKFAADAFANRTDNNLLKDFTTSQVKFTTDTTAGDTLYTYSVGNSATGSNSIVAFSDGVIGDGTEGSKMSFDCSPRFYQFGSNLRTNYGYSTDEDDTTVMQETDGDYKLTLTFEENYVFTDMYLISRNSASYCVKAYEVYVSTDVYTLYSAENLVISYNYDGYTSTSHTTGKLNDAYLSEGQEFVFAGEGKPAGQYVGIKFLDASVLPDTHTHAFYFDINELGFEGYINPDVVQFPQATLTQKSNFDVTSKYPCTKVNTVFTSDDVAAKLDDNLLNGLGASNYKFVNYLDNAINISNATGNKSYTGLADGLIVDGTAVSKTGQRPTNYIYDTGNSITSHEEDYDYKFTISLDGTYDISKLYLFFDDVANYANNNYKIYVSDSADDLFNDENQIVDFVYNGYSTDASTGKLNATYVSEGQEFVFDGDTKPRGSYVGYKFGNPTVTATGHPHFFLISEAGVEGTEYIDPYKIEYLSATESQLADLTVTSNHTFTSVETAFAGDAFVNRTSDNLLANATEIKFYGAKATMINNSSTKKPQLYNGVIDDATDKSANGHDSNGEVDNKYGGSKLLSDGLNAYTDDPQAYLVAKLDGTYAIDDIYLMGSNNGVFAHNNYEIYVAHSEEELFNEENKVVGFNYTGYDNAYGNNNGGADNLGEMNADAISEGQEYTFGGEDTPKGSYVGVKFITYSTCSSTGGTYWNWCSITEFGVEGEPYVIPYNIKYLSATSDEQANLDVVSKYDFTDVETVFDKDAFANRTDNNLLKNVSFLNYQLKNSAGSVLSIYNRSDWVKDDSECQGTVQAFFDGTLVYGGAFAHGNMLHFYKYGANDYTEYYELSVDLGETYDITDMYIMFGNSGNYATYKYDLYVSDSKDTLFDEGNRVIAYNYDGYAVDGVSTGKLNHNYTSTSTMTSEGQEYKFTDEMPKGRYVGFKQYEGSKQRGGFLLISEFGVEGRKLFTLDESNLNDYVFINPVNPAYDVETVENYAFTVDVKNGGTVQSLTVDGTALTPVDGVYTVENATADMVLEVVTDRDAYSPKDGVWNGKSLKTKTTAYDTTIWDDVQFFETVNFYEGESIYEISTRREAKLLYPIDEIIAVQSYDLKETYYEGEDFNIVDGKMVLTENTGIPVYGTKEGQSLEDLSLLQENGYIDWSSNVGGFDYWSKLFWQYQLCVTYTHSEVWSEDDYYINAPESKLSQLDKFHEKAASGEETNVLFIGDSITVGHNASGMKNPGSYKYSDGADPSTQTLTAESNYNRVFSGVYSQAQVDEWGATYWADQVGMGLKEKYGDNIVVTNRGVSSSHSTWCNTYKEFLYGEASGTPVPDLVIISLGTNEQSLATETFVSNVGEIIEYLRTRNPDCCFVFVSPFYSNRRELDGTLTSFNVGDHEDAMLAVENGTSEIITNGENIVVVPNYSYFESFMNNKTVFDHLSDCTNHPNDFGSNVYAQNVLHTLGVIDDCAHTETVTKGAVDPTCEEVGYTGDKVCTVCGYIVESGTENSAIGHDWQVDKDREVKYCANECGTEELPIYIITFYSMDEKVIYEAVVDVVDGEGYLSEADITAANEAAPYVYGYAFIGWDNEVSAEIPFYASDSITATYQRDTRSYNTVLKDSQGNEIDTQQIEFDQRFTVTDDGATAFLVDGQVVGGKGSVTLYGCGELTIEASTTATADELSVSILKTVTEVVNDENVYRVFVHVYNPAEVEVSKLGVMFAPGSAYTDDASFTIEGLNSTSGKYITLDADVETRDLLASFGGIKTGVTRVVRAYAVANGENVYSSKVDKHTFN